MEEANAIIFMIDTATGITDLDEKWQNCCDKSTKPVFLVVNKVDNHESILEASEFYGLGFENISFLISMSGSGTGELLGCGNCIIQKKNMKMEMEKKSNCQNLRLSVSPMLVNRLC